MRSQIASFLLLALSSGALSAAPPEQTWKPDLQVKTPVLDFRPDGKAPRPFTPLLRPSNSATVEVWGEGPQETLRLFQHRLGPQLDAAYSAGVSADVGALMLSEFMAMDPTRGWTPSSASVWYNCLRPSVLDPRLTVFTTLGKSQVGVSATATTKSATQTWTFR